MKKRLILLGAVWLCILLLNLAAWRSTAFCDFYVVHIFPLWVTTYGRLTGLFSFSVGEWLLYLFALYLAVDLLLIFPGILLRKKKSGKRILKWLSSVPWMVTIVCVLLTLNCTILYHCSPIEKEIRGLQQSGSSQAADGELTDRGTDYAESTLERLMALREEIVARCNELSEKMPRDENGYVVWQEGMSTEESSACYGSLASEAVDAMRGISDRFPRLSGYFPKPKPFAASWFFSQQYMCGYYFPFSMEANYNDMMYVMNIPYTMCHELSHLKGYIQEDEANFLAYLACVESGNELFAYSGYLGVLYYVEEDLKDALRAAGRMELYEQLTPVREQVVLDDRFLTREAWEQVEEQSFLDTRTVSKASDVFLETNLTLNGVVEGTVRYSRVVTLLLLYYYGV